ncbi:MAG: hypothetical protein N2C14_08175, partial [Planctomycetales bacterium]
MRALFFTATACAAFVFAACSGNHSTKEEIEAKRAEKILAFELRQQQQLNQARAMAKQSDEFLDQSGKPLVLDGDDTTLLVTFVVEVTGEEARAPEDFALRYQDLRVPL